MASILDKYGIKEVADVVFYELDSKGAPSAPALYLDTLKVSTIEQSAETVDATGGKGNPKLLTWDTNKEIKLTLEDALFSAKSLAIMFGGTLENYGDKQEVLKTLPIKAISTITNKDNGADVIDYLTFKFKSSTYYIAPSLVTAFAYGNKVTPQPVSAPVFTGKNTNVDFVTFDLLDCTKSAAARITGDDPKTESVVEEANGIVANGLTIDITSNFDSNTYYITGDTFARNYESGKDEFLQFIVPKGKVSAEDVSLTMEADGDPATFSMTVNCLKAASGSMLKLVKYELSEGGTSARLNKGVASVLDDYDDDGVQNAGYSKNPAASKITATSQNDRDYTPITD